MFNVENTPLKQLTVQSHTDSALNTLEHWEWLGMSRHSVCSIAQHYVCCCTVCPEPTHECVCAMLNIHCQKETQARSRTAPNKLLYAGSRTGMVGCLPRSHNTLCAHPKPEKTTAFTPCPGKVESPTQYSPFTAVRLKGIPSIPKGRLAGMGPYDPSALFRNFLCVRGEPTSLKIVAACSPGKNVSRRCTRPFATCSFFCSYSSELMPFQLSAQSGVKMWTPWVPSGHTDGSNKDGTDTNKQPRGSCILSQSSTMM